MNEFSQFLRLISPSEILALVVKVQCWWDATKDGERLRRFFFVQIRVDFYYWTWTPKQRVCIVCRFDSWKPLLLVLAVIPVKCRLLETSILWSLTPNHIISSSSVEILWMEGVTSKSTMIPGYAYTGDLYSLTQNVSSWPIEVGFSDNEFAIIMSSLLKVRTTFSGSTTVIIYPCVSIINSMRLTKHKTLLNPNQFMFYLPQ
jgi:hypothetical protein